MSFETNINELITLYLADLRKPDIPGFVDQLFRIAAEQGSVTGTCVGPNRIRFALTPARTSVVAGNVQFDLPQEVCTVELPAARTIVRMICARLGIVCGQQANLDPSLYGDTAVLETDGPHPQRLKVAFTNTTDQQEFLIELI